MDTINHFDISWILTDGRISRDIIYSKLFENIGFNKENIWPYEVSNLQVFSDTTTHPWGYIELMLAIGEERDIRIVDLQLLVVPCKRYITYTLKTFYDGFGWCGLFGPPKAQVS